MNASFTRHRLKARGADLPQLDSVACFPAGMQYGFVINHDTCIGCHACTTACKAENDVPVGNFRTWVKYVEVGRFPKVRRHFLVQRCNHCSDAPCVTICPVNALFKRPDGIVDVDRDVCIGCRACMQACPYDALYLNDDLGAVEKCHFCAHRIDRGLAPACVSVCPVGAIVPGDLDDPNSPASRLKTAHATKARRIEQGTGPNVLYIGAHDAALEPGRAMRPNTYLWSDRPPHKTEPWPESLPVDDDAQVVLDAGHRIEWGWPVAAYLVTKGIAAGCALVAPFLAWFGTPRFEIGVLPEIVSLAFTLITLFLLIEDLAKPFAFVRLFTRPNFDSWLVKGGFVLTAFAIVTCATIASGLLREWDLVSALRWVNLPLAVATAGYTALLFKQCKGRDLWEHPLLLPTLLFQAVFCGALLAAMAFPLGLWLGLTLSAGYAGFWLLHYIITHGRQATANATQAAAFAREMKWKGIGLEYFALLLASAGSVLCVVSGLAIVGVPMALMGVFLVEYVYVRAAQLPPLS